MISLICTISNITQMNLSMKQKETHRHRIDCGCQRTGRIREGQIGSLRLYVGWINNKVLLCITGNHIQYPMINHNGKEYEKIYE